MNVPETIKFNWITQPFALANYGVSKVAVALVILRILPPEQKRLRWASYALIAFTSVFTILGTIFVFVQCKKPSQLWNSPTISDGCWDRWSYYDWSVFEGALWIFVDFALALLPISYIWSIEPDMKKRLGLFFLLGLGIL